MSLALIAGKVSKTINGSNLMNNLSKSVFGNSSFLRNVEEGKGISSFSNVESSINAIQNTLTDLSNALGVKDNMYVIGKIDNTVEDYSNDWIGRQMAGIASKVSTAISYWTGGGNGQTGVIIDGFDNFRGDISVALPDNPVMYDTSVTDQVVRNPNRITMRVYVDLMHTDDVVQNIIQSVADSFGGLPGMLLNAATGNKLNRVQKALNDLQWIQENGRPFKVYTPHKVYDNMMIEKIAPLNDQKMNEILAADITFKEIIPTQSLGWKNKTTARLAPTQTTNAFAKAVGWIN